MDFVNKLAGGDSNNNNQEQGSNQNQQGGEKKEDGGFLGGIGEKLNSAAGGGKESEKNEDYLDKGMLPLPNPFSSRCHSSSPEACSRLLRCWTGASRY